MILGSAPTHQRLGSQHHLSHHQPSSSGPPPAHAPPPAHGSVGSSNLISPLVGSLGASSKPGMAHSNSFQGSHHSSGQNPLGLHSSSMGGGSLLPPPPGLTSSSRPPSGLPPSSATQSHALQRGPPPSHQGIPSGPDPISRPRSTDIQVIGERFHNRGGSSPEPRQTVLIQFKKSPYIYSIKKFNGFSKVIVTIAIFSFRINLEFQVLLQNLIVQNVIVLNLLYLLVVGIEGKVTHARAQISFSR